MSSRSGSFRRHVFNVSVAQRSSLQGQNCLEYMSSKSGLFRGHVFKVRLV